MATLTVTDLAATGITYTLASAAGGGDEFSNSGREFLVVANGGVGSITVTLVTQQTIGGLALADQAVTVGAGVTKLIGPFPTLVYNDNNSRVQVTYSGVTTVTVGAFRLSSV